MTALPSFTPEAFPLSDARPGARLRVSGVRAGDAAGAGLERRLLELGLPRGAEIEVVKRLGRGDAPLVVAAFGTRLAIGAPMARAIQVTLAPAAAE